MSIRLPPSLSCRARFTFMSLNPSGFDFRLRVVRHVGVGFLASLRRSRWRRLRAGFGASDDLEVVAGWHEHVEDGGVVGVAVRAWFGYPRGVSQLDIRPHPSKERRGWDGDRGFMVGSCSWVDREKPSFSWKRSGLLHRRSVQG